MKEMTATGGLGNIFWGWKYLIIRFQEWEQGTQEIGMQDEPDNR